MLARRRAIRFIAVPDPNATFEFRMQLLRLGAEVVVVQRPDPVGGFLQARPRAVAELLEESPRLIWTNRYENPASPLMHYLETGPELHRQAVQRVQTLFASVSTAGRSPGSRSSP